MPYYKICPDCGATLDRGEPCDCTKKERPEYTEAHNKNITPKEYHKTDGKARAEYAARN